MTLTPHRRRAAANSFTPRFALALAAGLAAAVILAPIVADAAAALGFRFPFPRIFDRVVMAALLAALLIASRRLRFIPLVRAGFAAPQRNLGRFAIGLGLALAALAILFAIARAAAPAPQARLGAALVRALVRALAQLPAALAIALIEEAFFRAFLLAGMRGDCGARGALIASSAFYAVVHLLRSPAHYYVTGFHPAAGLETLRASAALLGHPAAAAPALLGLFLLGIALGETCLLTGNVWMAVGMHAGFVLGAKSWGVFINGAAPPRWIAGPGPVPLIAAPAAWVAALALCALLPRIARPRGAQES